MSKKNQTNEVAVLEETAVVPNQEQTILSDTSTNVSQKIRALSALGHKPGPIVKYLTESGYVTKNGTPIRFQHVRNVLNQPLKKS